MTIRRIVYEIIFLLSCICIGFCCLCFSKYQDIRDTVRVFINPTFDVPKYNWLTKAIILIVALSVGLIFIRLMRLIVNSKNVKQIKIISEYLMFLIVGLPITHIILQYDLPSQLNTYIYIIFYILCFYLMCRIITALFVSSYFKILDKPVKNCRVVICHATSKTTFEVINTLIKNLTFDHCYNYINNYVGEPLKEREFFTIEEVSWLGKVVDSHSYYKNGDLIESIDDFLVKCYSLDKQVNWGF